MYTFGHCPNYLTYDDNDRYHYNNDGDYGNFNESDKKDYKHRKAMLIE